ncbi:phenylalanine--tRNA ligase subunit beta [Dermabacteraceae bacterium P13138]
MPRIPLSWLGKHVALAADATAEDVAAALVSVGLEEEAIYGAQVTGPLVIGRVLDLVKEPQKNGKLINWCRVDVGPEHNEEKDNPKDPQPGEERPSRGIICGAHNFEPGDLVVVSLPGTVLPGPFPIAARKTYGHVSDGMICSTAELGLGEDAEDGIIVLGRGAAEGITAQPGDDAISLFGLGEQVVEINVTPDRGYCFSMRGVAREYSHATGASFTDPAQQVEVPAAQGEGFPVVLRDEAPIRGNAGCSRYVAQLVTGVDASRPSPRWMQQALTLAGMRPISLVVDIANYVMLDLGQPLHTFDADTLTGPIVVRRARQGEKMTSLDGKERTLDAEDLLIADSRGGEGARPVAIAGVMGGADTEVSEGTQNILLEGATFDRVSIARSSRRHRLPSEAAKRFERGVDPALAEVAVLRAAQLIAEYGGGQIAPQRTDVRLETSPAQPILLPADAAEKLIGVAYTEEQIESCLRMIGCELSREENGYLVTAPSWRPDLTGKEELIEEIARLVGYDKIPSLPVKAPGGSGLTRVQRGRRSALNALAEYGYTEVLSYPFVPESRFAELGYAQDDPRTRCVRLLNPLADTEPLLRSELLQTLLPVARLNLSRGAQRIALMESGLVTLPGEDSVPAPIFPTDNRPSEEELSSLHAAMPTQPRRIAGVVGGALGADSWFGKARTADWTDALAAVERLAAAVGTKVVREQAERAPWHPGRCARIVSLNGDVLGYAGELHPAVIDQFGLFPRTSAFEIDLDALILTAPGVIAARPVPTFPVAKEDFAFVVAEEVPASEVEAAIVSGIGAELEEVSLFDVYRGEQLGEGKKSLAFAVRLRSADGTLSAKQIQEARNRCVKAVEAATGAQLRA